MKYVKKPLVIDAIQFTVNNVWEINAFVNSNARANNLGELIISTLEGDIKINLGDYVIKGIFGEFYSCKSDIFEVLYDEVKK